MRYLLGLFLTIACVTAFVQPEKPKPTLSLHVVAFDSATVTFQATVTLKAPLRAGDAIRYNWFKDAGLVTAASKDTVATVLTSVLPSPACGQSSGFQVKVKMVYSGVVDTRTVASSVVPYTAQACPPPVPTIDTVTISPKVVSLLPGGTQQFTARTNTGKPVVWTLEGPGTLTQTGFYTASF